MHLFCGIQGSGKSSFYLERFYRTHVRINLDMLRTRHREAILLEACLRARQPLVVDNTNPTPEERARYLAPARVARFRVVAWHFDVPLVDAFRRNAERAPTERIPPRAIAATLRRLIPPRREEGFDLVHHLVLAPDGRLVVAATDPPNIATDPLPPP